MRKRKLPLESMIWLVVGMSVFCHRPLTEIVNLMDIVDSTGSPFTARSSVIQRRKTLGENAVRELFELTQQHWHEQANHPHWHGLRLCGVDGVVWRTQDTPENNDTFGKASNQHGERGYPQVRKQWAALPEEITARLVTRKIDGVERQVLTSLTDACRYPGAAVVELYRHRWEIELGYREAKQRMLCNRWTLRSRLPEMVRQELWGVLLTYIPARGESKMQKVSG